MLQVLSARSASNSIVHNVSPTLAVNGRMETRRCTDGSHYRIWNLVCDQLASRNIDVVRQIVAESRDDYMQEMLGLIADVTALGKPIVLLWLSFRDPEYTIGFDKPEQVMGGYPQFVDAPMFEALERACTLSVRVRGDREQQPLWRSEVPVDGTVLREGMLYNAYYPTPKMHRQAADALVPALKKVC